MDLTSEAAIDEPPDKVDETEIESQLITPANGPTEYALLVNLELKGGVNSAVSKFQP